MLISITDRCMEQCTHCMADATPTGKHMSDETWEQVLGFLAQAKPTNVCISGGEPTLHPRCGEWVRTLRERGFIVSLLSNGSFLESGDDDLISDMMYIARELHMSFLQITTDSRFYPNHVQRMASVAKYKLEGCTTYQIKHLLPYGRARNNHPESFKSTRSPTCANIFLVAKQLPNLPVALRLLEEGYAQFCKPVITRTGDVHPGEAAMCPPVGHVLDGASVIFDRLRTGGPCGRCGLTKNIHQPEMRKLLNIGEQS